MSMAELSILIPSRQEKYLQHTVDDINEHKEADTEVLCFEDDGRGQRAATNHLARQAKGKYVMKTDAHCSFAQGFDRIMLQQMDDRTILTPILMPLDGESWAINGKKQMTHYAFDTNFVMQHVPTTDNLETMCLQGSCWMVSLENYWKWDLGDETMPSWGSQAIELGIKAYLNGGRCKTTRAAYYGHVFKTQDAEFPYDRGNSPGKEARDIMIKRYKNQRIAGLIRKFNYPCDWDEEKVKLLPKYETDPARR